MASCIDDSVDDDAFARLDFTPYAIEMSPLLSGQSSPAYKLMVYNTGDKILNIDRISVTGNDPENFTVIVDGKTGNVFSDVEIRGGDSIFVFVESCAPMKGSESSCSIDFTIGANTSTVRIVSPVIEAKVLTAMEVSSDESWQGDYYILQSLKISYGASLELLPSTNLYFADGASMTVEGTLVCSGTDSGQVMLQGDRFDDILPDVNYILVPGQWKGLTFSEGSVGDLAYTSVLNAENNITAGKDSRLSMFNCRVSNASGNVLTANSSTVDGIGCELTDAGDGVLDLTSSKVNLAHATVANFYLFSYPVDPIISLRGENVIDIDNSVVFGLSSELYSEVPVEGMPVYFRNCMFASQGTDDNNFIGCFWETDPLLNVSREDYIFDFTPRTGSPVLGASDPSLTPASWIIDRYGNPVGTPAPVGAYSVP